jgi:hypothetical protein
MDASRLVPEDSLLTETPEAGRQLAVKMARLIVKFTQPDAAKREALRDVYANDPGMLIALAQVVATEFATIAAANDYWRGELNPSRSLGQGASREERAADR